MIIRTRYLIYILAGFLVLTGCSKKKKPALQEPVVADDELDYDDHDHDMDDIHGADAPGVATPAADGLGTSTRPRAAAIQQNRWLIRYVTDDTEFYEDNSASNAKGRLSRGDVVAVEINGDWAVTGDGRYVKADVLSDKPVGRKRSEGAWRSP